MIRHFATSSFRLALLLVSSFALPHVATAQNPGSWSAPFPAHRIAENVYYVGTEDLGCFLITDPAGHILINTGLEDSAPLITASIEKLGFKVKDIKILLTNQAHYDHVAAFAEMQKRTGAKVFASAPDAALLEAGGKNDPAGITPYAPVKVDRILKDNEVVRLGKTALRTLHTFGHTQGSSSFQMEVQDGGKKKTLLFANMGSVVMPLSNPKYPTIVADFEKTFARQKLMHPDIWVAAHGAQYGLAAKYKTLAFEDPKGFQEGVAKYEGLFRRQLKIELGR